MLTIQTSKTVGIFQYITMEKDELSLKLKGTKISSVTNSVDSTEGFPVSM